MHEGQAYFERGLILAARECLEKLLQEVRRGKPSAPDLCTALNALGSVYLELNKLSEADECFSESVQISIKSSLDDQVRSWCNLSLCQYLSGMSKESVTSAGIAHDKARSLELQNPRLHLHSLVILGLSHIACAQWDKAHDILEIALLKAQELDVQFTTAELLNNLGLIYVELGDFDQAEAMLTRAQSMMLNLGNSSGLAYTTTELGRLYLKRGDLAKALHYGSSALRTLWDNMSGLDKAEMARLCELFGTVAYATGDRQGAIGYLQRAATYYGQQDRWQEWEQASATLTKVLRSPIQPAQNARCH